MKRSEIKNHYHSHCSRKAGFTLIEFLIYSVIVTLLVGALVLIGSNILQGRVRVAVAEEVNHNGKIAMEKITYHIRKADSINSPIIGSSESTLSLNMSVSTENPTVFEVDIDNRLTVKRGVEDAAVLTSGKVKVSSLNFTNVSYDDTSGTVKIEMTIKYNAPVGREEYDFERIFYTTENLRK